MWELLAWIWVTKRYPRHWKTHPRDILSLLAFWVSCAFKISLSSLIWWYLPSKTECFNLKQTAAQYSGLSGQRCQSPEVHTSRTGNVNLSLGTLSQVSRTLHNWSWSTELKSRHCRTFESWQDSYSECSKRGAEGSQERSLGWTWSVITWWTLVERDPYKSTLQMSLLRRDSMTSDSHGLAWGGNAEEGWVTISEPQQERSWQGRLQSSRGASLEKAVMLSKTGVLKGKSPQSQRADWVGTLAGSLMCVRAIGAG